MVLEYIHGPTLGEYLSASGPTPLSDAVRFLDALCDVVAACHAEDITHRDLKPTNILLRDAAVDLPVVVDFGLSFNRDDSELGEVTRVGEEVGKPISAAPGTRRRWTGFCE
jgi:eukaryotic-like serine/threonine-protein kinase